MASLSDYLEEQKKKTKTSNPIIESILSNRYIQNNRTSLPPSAEVPVSNDFKSYQVAPSFQPSTSVKPSTFTQENEFLKNLKTTQSNEFLKNLNVSQDNEFLKKIKTTQQIKTKPTDYKASTGIDKMVEESRKAAEQFRQKSPKEQWKDVATSIPAYIVYPTVKFGYSAAKVPSDIAKYLQGVSPEKIAEQGVIDVSKSPTFGKVLPYLIGTDQLSTIQSSAITNKSNLIKQGVSPSKATAISLAQSGLDALVGASWALSYGKAGAKLLQKIAPNADEISSWATLGYPQTRKDMTANYYKLQHKYHPDLGGNPLDFQRVQTAYETLSKPSVKFPIRVDTYASTLQKVGTALTSPVSQFGKIMNAPLYGVPKVDISSVSPLRLPSRAGEMPISPYQPSPKVSPLPVGLSTQPLYQSPTAPIPKQPELQNAVKSLVGKYNASGAQVLSVTPVKDGYIANIKTPAGQVLPSAVINDRNIGDFTSQYIQKTPLEDIKIRELVAERQKLLDINKGLENELELAETDSSAYDAISNQIKENGIKITKLTKKINDLRKGEEAKPPVQPQPIEEVKPIPKELEPLAEEARKYKSVEEFLKTTDVFRINTLKNALAKFLGKGLTSSDEKILSKAAIESVYNPEEGTKLYNKVLNNVLKREYGISLTDFYNQVVKEAKPEIKPEVTPTVEKPAVGAEKLITTLIEAKPKQPAKEPKIIQDIVKKIETPATQYVNPIISQITQPPVQPPIQPPVQPPTQPPAEPPIQPPAQPPAQPPRFPTLPQPFKQFSKGERPFRSATLPDMKSINKLTEYISIVAKRINPIVGNIEMLKKSVRGKVIPLRQRSKTVESAEQYVKFFGTEVGKLNVSQMRQQNIQEALSDVNPKYIDDESALVESIYNIADMDPASNDNDTATAVIALDNLLHGQDVIGSQLSALGKTISIYNRNLGEDLQVMGDVLSGKETRMSLYRNPMTMGIRTFEQTLTDYFKGTKLFGDIGTLIRNCFLAPFISPSGFGKLLKINAHIYDLKWQQDYALQTATDPYFALLRTFKGTYLLVETQRPVGFIEKISNIFGQESFPVRLLSSDRLTLSNSIDTASAIALKGALKSHDPIEGLLIPEYSKNIKKLADQVEIMFQDGYRHDERINLDKWNEFQNVVSEASQFAITSAGYEPLSKKITDVLSHFFLTISKTIRDFMRGFDLLEPFIRFKDPQIRFYAFSKRAEAYAGWLLSLIGAGIVLKHYKKGYFDLDRASPTYLRLVFTTGKEDDILMNVVNSWNVFAYLGALIHLVNTYITKSENIHYDITQPEKYYTRDIREFGTKDIYTDFLKLVEYKLNPLLGILVDILKMPTDEFIKKNFLVDTVLDWTPMPIFVTNFFENVIQTKIQLEQYGQELTPEQEQKIWRAFLPAVLGDFVGFSASAYNIGLNQEVRALMSQQMAQTGSPALDNAVIEKILKAGMKPATYKQIIREISQTESGVRTPEQIAFGRLPVQTQIEEFNRLPTDKMIEYYPLLNKGAMQEFIREMNNGIIKPSPRMYVFYLMITRQLTEDAVKQAMEQGISIEELQKMADFADSF